MLHYVIYNTEYINLRPCLIFIHGYTGVLDTWNDLYQHFQEDKQLRTFPAIFVDNLGSGKSPQPMGKYTTQMMADKILEIINFLRITNVILVGHSLGGAIAQQIAINDSATVDHLILVASFAKVNPICREFLLSRYELMYTNVSKYLIAKVSIPTIFTNDYIANPNNFKIAVDRIINNPQKIHGMYGQLQACLEHDTMNSLNKITCKTTIVTGNEDILVNKVHSQVLHKLINNSEIFYLNNCSHMVQIERPVELFMLIKG